VKRIRGVRGRRAAAVAAVALIAAGGAYAAIPGADGVINGCYRTSTEDQKGQLRVVEDPGSCRNNEQAIQWSQRGPQGPPGEDGADGVGPTVAQLPAGDANCPRGGAAITDAAGTTAYVCSGAPGEDGEPFSGTFASPNGQYSISVTDSGVTVASPDSSIEVAGNAIRVQTTGLDTIELRGGGLVRVESGTTLDLRSSAGASLRAAGVLTLNGSIVTVNGPGCAPAARLGDTVTGFAGTNGVVVANIITGSPTVCIGG
jgi:hypothetical protein